MHSHIQQLKENWEKSFGESQFKINFILTLVFLVVALLSLTNFLDYNEARTGFRFDDPILSLFQPIDVTWITFLLIYVGLLATVLGLIKHPPELIIILQSYTIMVFTRIVMMYVLPLEPPELLIPLIDPFVELVGNGQVLEKDLFFSGHTSTMFLFFLASKNVKLKSVFLFCTIIIGTAVLIQHVHYTIDVLVAPFIAYSSYRIAYTLNRMENGKNKNILTKRI